VIIDFDEEEKPTLVLDWDENVSKMALLISTKASRLSEKAGKPIFRYKKDMAVMTGKYTLIAIIENEEREKIKRVLYRIYKDLLEKLPITSEEIGNIAIKNLL